MINKIIVLSKGGPDTINDVILVKYHKCPSIKILKHANVLAKVNKFP